MAEKPSSDTSAQRVLDRTHFQIDLFLEQLRSALAFLPPAERKKTVELMLKGHDEMRAKLAALADT